MSRMKQKKKRKQILENAEYGLEISPKKETKGHRLATILSVKVTKRQLLKKLSLETCVCYKPEIY